MAGRLGSLLLVLAFAMNGSPTPLPAEVPNSDISVTAGYDDLQEFVAVTKYENLIYSNFNVTKPIYILPAGIIPAPTPQSPPNYVGFLQSSRSSSIGDGESSSHTLTISGTHFTVFDATRLYLACGRSLSPNRGTLGGIGTTNPCTVEIRGTSTSFIGPRPVGPKTVEFRPQQGVSQPLQEVVFEQTWNSLTEISFRIVTGGGSAGGPGDGEAVRVDLWENALVIDDFSYTLSKRVF